LASIAIDRAPLTGRTLPQQLRQAVEAWDRRKKFAPPPSTMPTARTSGRFRRSLPRYELEESMTAQQAEAFLRVLRANYYRVAEEVDLELMPHDRRRHLVNDSAPAKPFFEAAWFARQGAIISAWSLWDCYSRLLCVGLPVPDPGKGGSCVAKLGRSLAANGIPFPQQDWFDGANALRNIIAHYSCRVVEAKASEFMKKAKLVAFPELSAAPSGYVNIESVHVSEYFWKIKEFIRGTASRSTRTTP
jgi:hypothetical protein